MSNVTTKDLNYYLSLDYSIVINKVKEDDHEYYFGKIAELEGCHTDADTVDELMEELEEVKEEYLKIKLEHNDTIPEPNEMPSGKIVLRMPKTLHWRLAGEAAQEGVSLNQYMIYKLSRSLDSKDNEYE
ncbi:toxin-antitoxin system HicB family antitoxin [Rossellomorea vietnamensis]|uniref:Toxin-antitoxin system HicB family antitoxin n=1 Tax=Rossellomorea vietnamensis TaxID=218284 RepID=A0A5D4NRZ1_9BACI|nr:toxin-antitoxin system HicB family antitoxin [Rossellomorea vietnamensis]TYS17103.1 toxin-antitoxin system HicB family antitoxin [Rossellomorea vietnamensis]